MSREFKFADAGLGLNFQWSSFFVEELCRSGVKRVVVAPGGRSMSLVVSVYEHTDIKVYVHPDERGAAFFALGLAKRDKAPVAVISTSGTAVANFFPAVLEARKSALPLVVVTADLPAELSGCGENQTIEQPNFFSKNALWSKDYIAPQTGFDPIEVVRSVSEGLDFALGKRILGSVGPVHFNCRFRKPLIEKECDKPHYLQSEVLDHWMTRTESFSNPDPQNSSGDLESAREPSEDLSNVMQKLALAKCGILSCSNIDSEDISGIVKLAKTLRWPLLSDVTSQALWTGQSSEQLISRGDFMLTDSSLRSALEPDLIIHFGSQPLQNSLNSFFADSKAELVVVNSTGDHIDPWNRVSTRLRVGIEEFVDNLPSKYSESALLEKMRRGEELCNSILSDELKGFSELEVCREVGEMNQTGDSIFIGNSIAVRAFDSVSMPASKQVELGFNRGVSGIDGLLATAAGFGEAGRQNNTRQEETPSVLTVVLGDMSAFHDMNSLALIKKSSLPIVVVVLNNGGGQIFSMLPAIPEQAAYEDCFVAPQELDFSGLSSAFGLDYFKCEELDEFREAYLAARKLGKSSLVEVCLEERGFRQTLGACRNSIERELKGIV